MAPQPKSVLVGASCSCRIRPPRPPDPTAVGSALLPYSQGGLLSSRNSDCLERFFLLTCSSSLLLFLVLFLNLHAVVVVGEKAALITADKINQGNLIANAGRRDMPNYSSLSHPANKAINSSLREQTASSEALLRGIAGFQISGMLAPMLMAKGSSHDVIPSWRRAAKTKRQCKERFLGR